jgi:hypothetical protein
MSCSVRAVDLKGQTHEVLGDIGDADNAFEVIDSNVCVNIDAIQDIMEA